MQSYKLNIFFVLYFFPAIFFGQDPYYINYDTKDGLPSSEVYDVNVDSTGVVWFTSDRGISSFNGYEFKTFTTKDGLSYNTHLRSFEDREGRIWYVAFDGTLTILEKGRLRPFKWNDKLKELASGSWLDGLAWDHSGNLHFKLIAKSKKYSINEKNGQISENTFKSLDLKFTSLVFDSLSFINLDGYFLPDDHSFGGFKMFKLDDFYVYMDNRESPLFGGKTINKISKISTSNNSYQEFNINNIINIFLDNQNTLWVCSSSGLYRFENADLNQAPQHYFKDITITSIKDDFEGNYWITSTENGVLFVPSFDFHTFENNSDLLNKEKTTVVVPLEQNILFGNSIGEIKAIDKDFKLKPVFVYNDKRLVASGVNLKNKAFINDLIISEEKGFRITKTSKIDRREIKILELKNGQFLAIHNRGFTILTEDVKWPIDFHNIKPDYIVNRTSPYFLKKVISLIEHNSTIWIGTTTGLYSSNHGDFDKFNYEGDHNPLLQKRINDIKIDRFNNLWLSTIGEGILYKTQDTLFRFSSEDGLISDLVNRTFIENDSTLWIATNKGLNKLIYSFNNEKVSIKKIESLTTSDGLLTNYINDITSWNDHIWLATNKGINYFTPTSIDKDIPAPKIILEEFTVNDSVYRIKDNASFRSSQNDLYFKFIGISYRKQKDQPFYRYRLISKNADSTWYYTNNRDVRFNDLLAGSYTFEAAAQNKFGQWSQNPIIYKFTINPHFTQTFWFRTIALFAVIALIFFVFQTRGKRIKREEEQKRKVQEAELQALRNQMNPHFVFNALNSIQNFVFKNDAKKANYYLSRFSKLMRDGLQFARLKYISLKEEIIFLNTYLELEKMRFPDKFKYRVIVDENIPTNQYFIPPLLFQPILENAVKHAFKNIDYEGLLEIHFEEKVPGELLKITITDNGEGFNLESVNKTTNSKNKSLGLEIVNNQIALLNAEGKDRKASFRIFNRNSLDTQLTGMQAEFIISIKFSEND